MEENEEYDFLDLQEEIETNVLFPQEFDFGSVCPCDDCHQKIKMLKKFEEEIHDKRELVRECQYLLQQKLDHGTYLASSSRWAIKMLRLLHHNLKIVSKKGGITSILQKDKLEEEMEYIDDLTVNLIFDHLISRPADASDAGNVVKENDDILPLALRISRMRYHYENTKFKDVTDHIFNQLEEIEKAHEHDMKCAQAEKKPLDPIISQMHIEKQIRLVKTLPLNEMYHEALKLVKEISPFDERSIWLGKAYNDIMATLSDMITVRFEFWLRYQSASPTRKDHALSGLKDTLEILWKKATLFNDRWEKDHAPYFTTYERKYSHPKRQRTNEKDV
ncbi:unnamed protein product [Cuscuta epithymum]|uniref:Uncharacterized protein n=1 Tax=Cuscuta epithymum TaxID=186058 RepID=A0AAV0CTU7_9ASTE|nr:unnamed protein product [Cuscuta epithymum]